MSVGSRLSSETQRGNPRLPIAVLISGAGRSLANLLRRIERGQLDACVKLVVCSRADVRGVEIAKAAGIPTQIVARRDHPDASLRQREREEEERWRRDQRFMERLARRRTQRATEESRSMYEDVIRQMREGGLTKTHVPIYTGDRVELIERPDVKASPSGLSP